VDYSDPKLQFVGKNFNVCTTPTFWAIAKNPKNRKSEYFAKPRKKFHSKFKTHANSNGKNKKTESRYIYFIDVPQTIQILDCHQNDAVDADKNGWYTCPNFQLPIPRQ